MGFAGLTMLNGYPSGVHRSIIDHVQGKIARQARVVRHPSETWGIIQAQREDLFRGITSEMYRSYGRQAGLSVKEVASDCLEGMIIGATMYDESSGVPLVYFARNEIIGRVQQAIKHEIMPERAKMESLDGGSPRDGRTLSDILPDHSLNPEIKLVESARRELFEKLEPAISGLSKMDRDIIRSHFGMDDPEGRSETNDQIGKRYGVSRETIRTRLKEILKNLRELLI